LRGLPRLLNERLPRLKNYIRLNFSLLYWLLVAPFAGRGFKLDPIFRQMVFIGVRAAPMVALTAFSVGVTLAMQAAHSLQQLGAEIYVPDLVMVTLLREMGPVLIAVIVIGRSGSAVAAELGTMKVSEEIEALEVMAINPIQYLVVPRFLAMLVMLPALTIFGNYIGVLGGVPLRARF
jgi:phospholipid/cholesterol/gamma-HCH transport system permease protein